MKYEECKVKMRVVGTMVVDGNIRTNGIMFSSLFQCPKCKMIEMIPLDY